MKLHLPTVAGTLIAMLTGKRCTKVPTISSYKTQMAMLTAQWFLCSFQGFPG